MKLKFVLAAASALAATALIVPASRADTLATPAKAHVRHHHYSRHYSEHANVPWRGMSMAQVEKRFGAPVSKLPAAGGDTPRHPVIHRWRYNGYTVYFERTHVIHSVLDSEAVATKS